MLSLTFALVVGTAGQAPADPPPLGAFRAWLACPGGDLPFGLVVARDDGGLRATIRNGPETIDVSSATWNGRELVLELAHYDARITCHPDGDELVGEWSKRRGVDRWARLPFHARAGALARFEPRGPSTRPAPAGRFAVDFSSDDDPAVGEFAIEPDGTAHGTFLTTLGDYRYLAGAWHGDVLELSCFDGAHAFLFRARPHGEAGLAGDFWSSGTWHETWTATPDADAALPDPFEQVRWTGARSVDDLAFPDVDRLDAGPRPLADWRGRPRILQVFGTWGPNCCDETRYLAELDERFRDRGLAIIGIAFEHTGRRERDAEQVARWRERFGARYPVLLGGVSDKARATEEFGALDRIKSYPTTIFVDKSGRVRAIHSGFAGPATGPAHARLRERFEALIHELLAE